MTMSLAVAAMAMGTGYFFNYPSGVGKKSLDHVTQPALALDCQVVDRSRTWHRVKMQATGARGYWKKINRGTEQLAVATDRKVTITSDPSNLFRGLKEATGAAVVSDMTFGDRDGEGVRLDYGPVEPFKMISIIRLKSSRSYLDGEKLAGFCDIAESPQQPLTPEETERYLNQ